MESLKIKRYDADELHSLFIREDFTSCPIDQLETVAKIQSIIDRVTSHKCDCINRMCCLLGIKTEGKSIQRLACEICAFTSDTSE